MHEHKQCQCEHELKYCPICDVCYCTKCGKEWKYNFYYTWYNNTYPTTYYNSSEQPPVITCSHHENKE